jgi:rubrerythrin
VLKLALKKERYTIAYYTALTEFTLGPENLKVIQSIVQEEKRHVRILAQSLNQAIG